MGAISRVLKTPYSNSQQKLTSSGIDYIQQTKYPSVNPTKHNGIAMIVAQGKGWGYWHVITVVPSATVPYKRLLYHLQDKPKSSSFVLAMAVLQRSPFAFVSGHLSLVFQKLRFQCLLAGLAGSLQCRCVCVQL